MKATEMQPIDEILRTASKQDLLRRLIENAPENRPATNNDADRLETPIQTDHSNTPLSERHVNVSNQITRSAQGLGLAQKRIMALAIAKNDSKSCAHIVKNKLGGWAIRLTAKDYADTYEVDVTNAYHQLRTATDGLLKTIWEIVETKGHRTTRTRGSWLYTATYHDQKGMIDLAFHPEVAPHLLALEREFTTYKLKHAAALRSIYSWRLYECLQSWKTTSQWTVSIEDFHKIMETPPAYLTDFGQTRRHIIQQAVKELTRKNNMLITWTARKEGRNVVELTFNFEQNPQEQLPL